MRIEMSNRAERRRYRAANRKMLKGIISGAAAGARYTEMCRRAGLPCSAPGGYRTQHTPWTIADVLWFQGNRNRTHRIRPPILSELSDFGDLARPPGASSEYRTFIIVRQVEPGRHFRVPIWLHGVCLEDDTDAHLSALLDATIANSIAGMPGGNLDDIRAKAAASGRLLGHA
jgi:hypothetical protein